VKICTGFHHTLVLDDVGQVFSFGDNKYGQLGLGHRKECSEPQLIQGLKNITVNSLAAGMRFSGVVDSVGNCYTWGTGEYGELGQGPDILISLEPRIVELGDERINLVSIVAGAHHVLSIVKYLNHPDFNAQRTSLRVWGRNNNGQLGIPGKQPVWAPQVLNGKDLYWKSSIIQVAAGYRHSALVTQSGDLWTWGRSRHGQLCNGREESDRYEPRVVDHLRIYTITQVSCGEQHTAILTDQSKLLIFGGAAQNGHVIQCKDIKQIDSCRSTLYAVSRCGRAYLIECETNDSKMNSNRPLSISRKKEDFVVTPISDPISKTLKLRQVMEPIEEARYFDELMENLLLTLADDGSIAARLQEKTWDVNNLNVVDVKEPFKDRSGFEVRTAYYTGKSMKNFQVAYRDEEPLAMVERLTEYAASITQQLQLNGTLKKFAHPIPDPILSSSRVYLFKDFLMIHGYDERVKFGNNISGDLSYDIKALGRRLEDDNIGLEMRRIFYYFDKDASGEIDVLELYGALHKLGYSKSMRHVRKIIGKYDTNHNGTISLDEFIKYVFDQVKQQRKRWWITKTLVHSRMAYKTEAPPEMPPVIPAGKLRRLEQDKRVHKMFRKQLRMEPRVFPDTYMRFVKIFMEECVTKGIWGQLPLKLKKQIAVPTAQPLYHIGEIDLSDCDMEDCHVEALCKTLKCAPFIRRLDLRGNRITDDGALFIVDLLKSHDELADYVDCAKCLACAEFLAFQDTRDPRTPLIACSCMPESRGGQLYALPVYFVEQVFLSDPLSDNQRMTNSKIQLALNLDVFSTEILQMKAPLASELSSTTHLPELKPFEDDILIAKSRHFSVDAFRGWIDKRVEDSLETGIRNSLDSVFFETKLKEIRRLFLEADADKSGFLDVKEISGCLKELGISKNKKIIQEMIDSIDSDGNNLISMSEFEKFALNLASDQQVKLLGKSNINNRLDENGKPLLNRKLALKQDLEDFQNKSMRKFADLLYEQFLLPRYQKFAHRKLQEATIVAKNKFYSKCRALFHKNAPHSTSSFGKAIDQIASDGYHALTQQFNYSAQLPVWERCKDSYNRFRKEIQAYYNALNNQVKIQQVAAGCYHSSLLSLRGIPWVKGFQDDGCGDTASLWVQRTRDGIRSIEDMTS